MFFHFQ